MSICLLSILLFQSVQSSRRPFVKEGEALIPFRYIWGKLQFGRQWQVYIQVMTYDLLRSIFSGKKYLKTLLDVARNLRTIAAKKHPCRRGIFAVFERHFRGNIFLKNKILSTYFFAADFRICGVYSINFNPGSFIDESNIDLSDRSLKPIGRHIKFVWHLQAGAGFSVNCTVSEFTAPRSHGCGDARVNIRIFVQQKYLRPQWLCPNTGTPNIIAERVKLTLKLNVYRKPLFLTKDQRFTIFSVYYQIVDGAQLTVFGFFAEPTRQNVELGKDYTFGMGNFSDHLSGTFLNVKDSLYLRISSGGLISIFSLYLDEYLTPVIFRQNISCNTLEGELIFFDGPVQLTLKASVPVLKYWKCSHTYNPKDNSGSEEVRGSVGALTVVFLSPTRSSREEAHKSAYLAITWHAERMLPDVLRIRQIVLDLSTVTTIHFHPTRNTSIDVVNVQAPVGKFVHLGFTELGYVLHTEIYESIQRHYCLDGFEIKDPMQFFTDGQICSNSTAENVLTHYQPKGLTFGQDIVLTKKQYAWLGTISAVITASVHNCAGYINVYPAPSSLYLKYQKPGSIVTFEASTSVFENNSFSHYIDLGINFMRLTNACCKFQIVPFEHFLYYASKFKMRNNPLLKYMITSEDLTSPARFIIDVSTIGSALHVKNISSSYGLRLYLLNARLVKPTVAYPGIWGAHAYSTQITFDPSHLTHVAGFKLQVEDGTKPPVCTDERGSNVTFIFFDVVLLGPCAKAQLNTQAPIIVSVYKTYENRRCCYFNGYITIDHSIHSQVAMYLYYPGIERKHEEGQPLNVNLWSLSGNDNVIKFHIVCKTPCSAIFFTMIWDRYYLNAVSIVYRANLLDQTGLNGITFPQPETEVLKSWPWPITWNHLCHNHHCYSTPSRYMATTWDEAQKVCEENQASLVSINSDLEWALLTRLPLQERKSFIGLQFTLFYIGLVTDVSTIYLITELRASNYIGVKGSSYPDGYY